MEPRPIQISAHDHERIQLLLETLASNPRTSPAIHPLLEELARAHTLPERPLEAVGVGSAVEVLDLDSGEANCFTLTWPEQADPTRGRLSLLAPLGTALLGYSEGDELTWEMPGAIRHLRVQRVAQPTGTNTVGAV